MLPEDKKIISLFNNEGSKEQAFTVLVEKYHQRIYWQVRRMIHDHEDSNDLTQDIFIKIWNNLSKFRGDSKLYTFLYKITVNEVFTFVNKRKKRISGSSLDKKELYINSLKADPYFNGDEVDEMFQKAIQQLPEKQKIVFNMKYYEELTYNEMSEVLETSVGALKASYHHAVKKIKEYIKTN